jgi:hypothetical protein
VPQAFARCRRRAQDESGRIRTSIDRLRVPTLCPLRYAFENGDGGTRTHNHLLKRRLLSPVELHPRILAQGTRRFELLPRGSQPRGLAITPHPHVKLLLQAVARRSKSEGSRTLVCGSKVHRASRYTTLSCKKPCITMIAITLGYPAEKRKSPPPRSSRRRA